METVLIDGRWQASRDSAGSFRAEDPARGVAIGPEFPVSGRGDLDALLRAATHVAPLLARTEPERIAAFLDAYADGIEAARAELVALAHAETALPIEPRLNSVELPRTVDQLRQAARAARELSWTQPTIDTRTNLRAHFAPLGKPVVVFGPNNFPLAFNAVAGSDFACALVARHPVIAKVHPSHPQTSRRLAELAHAALATAGLPPETVQLVYQLPNELGLALVADPRVGAVGFTGSRTGGLALKAAADRAGVPLYAELSSVNPVFMLPGALIERGAAITDEFVGACTAGTGQFCTNPGLVIVPDDAGGAAFVAAATERFRAATPGVLLGRGVLEHLENSLAALRAAGAEPLVGGERGTGEGYRFQPTLLRIDAERFLAHTAALQTEAFGPAALLVVARDADAMVAIAAALEGNLTGSLYSARDGRDDDVATKISIVLRSRVGRLLNDKMPTGVAVSAAMNHGGPYPASSHAGFTSVGIPTAVRRFAALHCYDAVRTTRLPAELRDRNPTGSLQRCIDGVWSSADIDA
jgi:NADP-dependent aldehyde dehydrogenase